MPEPDDTSTIALQNRDSLPMFQSSQTNRPLSGYGNNGNKRISHIQAHARDIVPDEDILECFSKDIFPEILKNRLPGRPVRIWVPGCSTGEEVYSIAINLLEFFNKIPDPPNIQLFGTDSSEISIRKARDGIFSKQHAAEISCAKLDHYFHKVEGGYQIQKAICDSCIFARNIPKKFLSPANIDLIYFGNSLAEKDKLYFDTVFPVFYHVLRNKGFLIRWKFPDNVEDNALFTPGKTRGIYRKNTNYRNLDNPARMISEFADNTLPECIVPVCDEGETEMNSIDIQKERDLIVLSRYAPAYVLINDSLDIVQFRGHTGEYLEPAPGTPTLNVLKMAREGLNVELQSAIQKSRIDGKNIRRTGVKVMRNGQFADMSFEVVPVKSFQNPKDRYFLLSFFEESTLKNEAHVGKINPLSVRMPDEVSAEEASYLALQQELVATKEYLQSVIMEKESEIEELKLSIDDVQTHNEELRTINEEIVSAREELQSANDQLVSVNDELSGRNRELDTLNTDLVNLLESLSSSAVILDKNLKIRRFTPASEKLLNLTSADIGRSLGTIRSSLVIPDLEMLVRDAIATRVSKETDIGSTDGKKYWMNVRPYRTPENTIDGAVIVFFDRDGIK